MSSSIAIQGRLVRECGITPLLDAGSFFGIQRRDGRIVRGRRILYYNGNPYLLSPHDTDLPSTSKPNVSSTLAIVRHVGLRVRRKYLNISCLYSYYLHLSASDNNSSSSIRIYLVRVGALEKTVRLETWRSISISWHSPESRLSEKKILNYVSKFIFGIIMDIIFQHIKFWINICNVIFYYLA